MGIGSKIASIVFRANELFSAAIVVGILGHFLSIVDDANGSANGKVVYAMVIASLALLFSIVLMVPLWCTFRAFPLDFIMFLCWMVAFALLVNLTGTNACSSNWYYSYWGYNWGRYYRTPVVTSASVINNAGCADWRCVLAFSFISSMFWLASSLLVRHSTEYLINNAEFTI
ncbi:hypothetical protein AUEXF2481DRAFT_44470 [Aureobasidium subglaciale EXF-2481]|uniref:MARVEL domain-containing protein n=1 Tax=Aureobasidium subglaciale (strain EXF-2481) TaxID=1043005 RepID=A0A074Y554_AURSE|nr:uncharacterized protein AUEXF2481DRAFT_44470 [Aureobasidium subglaciale EXF-2481]KAI5197924.1 hypothetical protein E4T38_07727 [Aureobasidium subglaciale]KAI5216769.1 hypothetical protein E4T40_07737 [Aureobasidium subglaciale]KAI5220049.1 hypothetical protein E4T41_07652 [Aureobasidium subglaciale]KAI5257885.1 hypothetical protein E4T46_07628 [Aureobasidium subglaciale]KEQ91069.1 hypothetical protein AUEXF2481DRAFT_44470 [Aureobasidium subglaciale EXF-2481]